MATAARYCRLCGAHRRTTAVSRGWIFLICPCCDCANDTAGPAAALALRPGNLPPNRRAE